MSKVTDNYLKHTSASPIQKFLIDRFFKTLIREAKALNPQKVLDVGCGEGFTLEKLRGNNVGTYLEGMDFSETALEIGRKIHPDLTFQHGDIYALPYKNDSFDLVVCSEVLEHLQKPQDALKELIRVSSKYLLLTVPNEPFFTIGNFLRGKNLSRLGNDREHIQHWSTSSFVKFVSPVLSVKVVKRPFPWNLVVGEKKI